MSIFHQDKQCIEAITKNNYNIIKKNLILYLIGEIGIYVKSSGSMEKLSLLLNRSKLYVRMIIGRKSSIEKLETLLDECRRKIR